MVQERIQALRKFMQDYHMDLYLVPTADFHESEYAGEHFGVRKFLSGFTGSAGTLVVGMEEAGLWTDGRYFIQAERQLTGSGITLYRSGNDGVPTVEDFIEERLPEGGVLGFDGRVVNRKLGEKLAGIAAVKNGSVYTEADLGGQVWTERPQLSAESAFLLEIKYCGKDCAAKLADVRAEMHKDNADTFVLTSLDDIAWLFNIRGNDIPCNPVVLAFAAVQTEQAFLFANQSVLNQDILASLAANRVEVRPYEEFYTFVSGLEGASVLLDGRKVNYAVCSKLPQSAAVIDKPNPTSLMKAVKNETEITSLRASHLKDGIAVTRFMYWLKKHIGQMDITEMSAAKYLEDLRKSQEGYIEPSFDTIAAYNANAAMMHYCATEESNAVLKPEGFLLVDSGGQYLEGTTDITRTFVLGPVCELWKKHYTLVLKGMLNLANAKFLHGCTGINLDILARGPLWNIGMDYRCGTGHGVGFLLNVHEAPNGFRWKMVPERNDSAVLEEGMVTTDEPGVYVEDSHGIRIENELVCKKGEMTEYGQFMEFETITYAPIDLDAVDTAYLNPDDLAQLNAYHKMVYEKLASYLPEEERIWLEEYTRPL